MAGSGDVLMLRRIGYAPRAVRVADSTNLRIPMAPMVYDLDTIRVRADLIRFNPNLAGFYQRRKNGAGTYFTKDDIWKQNPIFITEMVRRTPNITCTAKRCTSHRWTGYGRNCTMQVILDGQPTERELDEIPPAWVVAIEVYRGGATSPIQWGSTGRGDRGPQCGTIAIWTGADDR